MCENLSANQLAFMHSLRALSPSALLMPLVFSLHIAILLLGFSGLAERQVFMNALRSSPFLSPACSLHIFILSCCAFCASLGALSEAAVLVSAVFASLLSAASAVPQANSPARTSVRIVFFEVPLEVLSDGIETSLRHPSPG